MIIHSASFIQCSASLKQCPDPVKPEFGFIGRSNVGKSSLINMLTGFSHLAKTSGNPGKTRTINHFLINESWFLVDLPGYGYARVSKETQRTWGTMVETYLRKRSSLKAVVVILDIRREPNQGDLDLLAWLKGYGRRPIVVLTKADKLSRNQSRQRAAEIRARLEPVCATGAVLFSAKTREGREEIWKAIREATEVDSLPGRRP